MTRFCLNGIVKNEAARIERMLSSVWQDIDYAVFVDTGSTDDTKQKIIDFCEHHSIPVLIYDAPFENWSQARNAALAWGRQVWCQTQAFDYFMLVDADMELKVTDRRVLDGLTGPSYDIYQHAGAVHYQNRRLLKADQPGQYLGVTHEYLDVASGGCLPESAILFIDHADGANRPEKFKRDIRLLKEGLREEPNNARYMFYLANSYRDAGMPEKAAQWFKRRVEAGGWDEEIWNAQANYAFCQREMKREDAFIREMLIAYNMRPTRVEPLYDLAKYYRERGENALGLLFAEAGCKVPYTKDGLFVNDYAHTVGCLEEASICAFYVPGHREVGAAACEKLALMRTPYQGAVQAGKTNAYWYIQPLAELCPSFKWDPIAWTPPEGWSCLNPSITLFNHKPVLNMRTVNYRMDQQGRYLIRGVEDDGKLNCNATADNPIHTRNWILHLDPGLGVAEAHEVLLHSCNKLPCEFPLVVGFEDSRIFEHQGALWSSSTVRQIAADGQCEQVLARIDDPLFDPNIGEWHRMLRVNRVTEKNWMPWVHDGKLDFMYQLGHIVNNGGFDISVKAPTQNTADLRGGSQVIAFMHGWLALVHEARLLPGSHLRYYQHRFVFFDAIGGVRKISRPFVFNDKVIEFAAGMCDYGDRLLISYGFKDEEARLGSISYDDVAALLGLVEYA